MRKTPELALLAQAFFAFKQVLSIDFFRVIAERSCVIPQTPWPRACWWFFGMASCSECLPPLMRRASDAAH
jgi:hypothetical protein